MGEQRRLPPEGFVERNMEGCRRHPFSSSNDMGNPHVVVVHHIGKMVCRGSVSFHQDCISNRVEHLGSAIGFDVDLAVDEIFPDDSSLLGVESYNRRLPLLYSVLHFAFRQAFAIARAPADPRTDLSWLGRLLSVLLAGTEAPVCMPCLEELVCMVLIQIIST